MKVSVRAYAKLNLSLDITGKRDDGYHIVEMLMQSVSLHDTVTVWDCRDGGIEVNTSGGEVADDETNIAYKAAQAFFAETGISNPGVCIKIKKRIPLKAGMAGGSADAAAVLVALNRIFSAGLDESRLCDIGELIGADVPFCITGGTSMARGIGNILSPLPPLPECYIVAAKPDEGVSTAEAYAAVDGFKGQLIRPDAVRMSEDICAGDLRAVAAGLCNVFEQAIDLPSCAAIKKTMLESGALGAVLTGSGSAVFALFEEKDDAEACRQALEESFDEVFLMRPNSCGCEIID